MVLPMDKKSAPFITYKDIDLTDTDLLDDAWGFRYEFRDVFDLLETLKPEPGPMVTEKLKKKYF